MSKRNLTLVIPNLDTSLLLHNDDLPSAKFLLTHAKKSTIPEKCQNILAYLFDYRAAAVPIAAIEACGAGFAHQAIYWLRLDPVQVQVEYKGVYLLGHLGLNLIDNELTQLTNELNELLQWENLRLYPAAQQWYLGVADDPQIHTYPLLQILGKEISLLLPFGARAKYWRKLLTELQMVVHGSQVNQQRQQQGLPLIGGVWLWGEGQLPKLPNSHWKKIWADDLLTQGLAKITNKVVDKLPINFNQCITTMMTSGDYLLVLDDLSTMQQWEQKWFIPILAALRSRHITTCTIYMADGAYYCLNRFSLWAWWRR